MWDLPGPGLKPMSPALAGGFLTTVPPGKSQTESYLNMIPATPQFSAFTDFLIIVYWVLFVELTYVFVNSLGIQMQ